MMAECMILSMKNRENKMDTINQIMVVCGWIISLGGAGTVIYNLYKQHKKPTDDLEHRINVIEKDIKDIKQKLNQDYNSINANREDMNLLMRSMFCLIENKITGNNIEGLKKTRDELINALTDK